MEMLSTLSSCGLDRIFSGGLVLFQMSPSQIIRRENPWSKNQTQAPAVRDKRSLLCTMEKFWSRQKISCAATAFPIHKPYLSL